MPPFVYRSLQDFVRATATAKTRQELLRKLITNAAKRKTQTHLDATGARMSTFPEMFGRSLAADMGKQAFVGAGLKMVGRGISNFARNQLSGGLGKFVGNIGNGMRGLGTQTQRAGLRLGNAAQPLVNEVKDMSNQVINRGMATIDRLPSWALPAASGAVVGGRVATDIHNDRELRRPSPLLQNKPLPQQGGLMANPIQETYSMNMNKQSGLANIGTHLMRDLPRMMERGLNRYGDLLGGHTAKKMFPVAAVAGTLKRQMPQMEHHIMSNSDGVLDVVNQQTIKRILDAYKKEVGKVVLTRGGTAGAATLGVNALSNALGEKTSAQTINKQANMALLRQILSPAMKQLRGYGANALSAAGRGGSRYMELLSGNKLKNMTHRYEHLMNMFGDYPTKNMMNQHGQIGYDVAANANGVLTDLQHKALSEAIKVYGTRAGTVGAGSLATAGGLAGIGRMQQGNNQPMLAKKSMTMPQPTSRGTMKKVQMPEASPSKPDCDPEGVQMSAAKQSSLLSVLGGLAGGGLGGVAGAAGGGLLGALGGGAMAGHRGAGIGLLSGGAAGLGAGAHMGGNIGANIGASFDKKKKKPESDKDKKEDNADDDKEVKEAAAVVLAQLKRNHTK